ncbi:MAG: acetate--CoA ligase family protein [Actinomycetota bacterium]|nr:acetate--CoA ligase family protein [Actinomycetota bacterium]
MAAAEPSPRERTALECMLEARTVAVVGASVKEGSLGRQMMIELRRGGFEGDVFPVNPGYEEIDGARCYPSVTDLPSGVDLVVLGVANARVEEALRGAAQIGARSAVTFASLYEDAPPSGSPPLQDRLAAVARDAGMAFCGGNGMGFLNLDARLRATGFPTPDRMRQGPVTFVTHSGSAFAALAFNDRGIGFNLVVSSGNEIVTTMSDYVRFALRRETTGVIALLLETVRDPAGLRDALAEAADREIPVVALKVGRTERSKAMVTAHSGALAGEHGAFEALFDAYGVHEVRTLDEMADTLELFSAPRRVRAGRGVASIHDSGGERAMVVDLAGDLGVPFAGIGEGTRARIQALLDPGLTAENPLDAWGTGIDADRIFRESLVLLHDDPETAVLVFGVDLTRQGTPYEDGYLAVAADVFAATTKPFCMLSNLASAVALEEAAILRDAGIPVLEGTDSGLRALGHLLSEGTAHDHPEVVAPEPVPDRVREHWLARLTSGREISELEGLALLADYGIPTVPARAASSAEAAVSAAEELGWPVVLKTAAPAVQHKSDVGGVVVGVPDAEALREVYGDLAARLGPQVTVAAVAPAGVELALGVVRDPTFGPLVLVAAGGVLVELLGDRKLALPPLDEAGARRLIDGLQVRPLLDGVRGAPASDVNAVAHAVSRLSVLAADLGDHLEAIDVNPVIAGPKGCVAVDALVVPRALAT